MNFNQFKMYNTSNILSDKRILSYVMLAEYELFVLHTSNGISSDDYAYQSNLGTFVDDILDYYDNKKVSVEIAVVGSKIRGIVVYRNDEEKGIYIVSLYVDNIQRKKGLAKELIEKIINETGAKKFTVLVGDFNTPAVNLYKKLGFKLLNKSNIKGMSEYQLNIGDEYGE